MPEDRPADLALVGGRLFTADPARTWAEALAVRDGRIVAIGGDRDVRPLIGAPTRVVELRGRTVVPGFQDAHVHPVTGALEQRQLDLNGCHGIAAYRARIVEYATAHPAETWLVGGGWSLPDFERGVPDAALLDDIVPDRPVYLVNRDGHDAWVNSRALELAGITTGTPDPPRGRIARRADGSPAGALHESAMELVEALLPAEPPERLEGAVLDGQAYLHSLGITAWQEASLKPELQAAYETVAGRGALTARVVGAMTWDERRGEEQIEELVERRARGPVGRFSPTSVKVFMDGIVETFTAAMLDDYLATDGRPSGTRGMSLVEPGLLGRAVTRLDALGFQVHFHALGDRAVREALDAVEAARAANGWSDGRHHLAHLQVVDPADRPRFRRLGAVANAQALWAVHEAQMDVLTIPFLGADRAARQYPWRSLRAAGATLAMGSDWSVSTADPLAQLDVAVNRMAWDAPDPVPFYPEERLELVDALAAFTAGSAWVNHLDGTGTLAAGRLADLAVLDRDLFDRGAGEIRDARVVATFVEGEPVFEASGLEG